MNRFSNQNPERIRYWILNNIHLVWLSIQNLQKIKPDEYVLRITFYDGSYPIVMQFKS